jgi:hypothetical protein
MKSALTPQMLAAQSSGPADACSPRVIRQWLISSGKEGKIDEYAMAGDSDCGSPAVILR